MLIYSGGVISQMEKAMHLIKAMTLGAILLTGIAASAQEFPKAEIALDYSYARFAPNLPNSQGHSLNGGGGSLTYNVMENLGIKAEFHGYGSTLTGFSIPGWKGNVQGNLFTYLFGPQIKSRGGRVNAFIHVLLGGAHTNVYGNAYKLLCQPNTGSCGLSATPGGDGFALVFGGGADVPINKIVSIRPAGVDYLMTRFTNPLTSTTVQNNFRYTAGVVFNLAQ